MMTAMVVAMIAVATTGQGSIEGIRDIQSPMPVRQVVLDAGVLYGINAQPTNGQCALLLVCPLDESKPKDALPLFGMCAMEFGGSPFCWNVENGKFNLVSITEPPPSIQGISRVGHASTSQLERFRRSEVLPGYRANFTPLAWTRNFPVLMKKRLTGGKLFFFHTSLRQHRSVDLYTLGYGTVTLSRSLWTGPEEWRVEEKDVFSQKTPLQGPFCVMRFGQRDYLLDWVGDVYRVEEKGIQRIGNVENWPQKDNPLCQHE